MNDVLRTQMLTGAEAVVNTLARWSHDHPEADLDQREAEVLQQMRLLMAGLLTLLVVAAAPRTPGRCPACGQWSPAPTVRQRPRTILSRCGLLRLARELVTCRDCGTSWAPLDRVLGLQPFQRLTTGLREDLVQLGIDLPFVRAARQLWRLTGLAVGAETIRRHTEAVGLALEQRHQETIQIVQRTQQAAEPLEVAPGQLLVETDGVMVHFLDSWHEVRLGLVAGVQDGELVAASYVAARESAAAFGPRLVAEAARRGALEIVGWQSRLFGRGRARLRSVVVLGDGARWIWKQAFTCFGRCTEIVDFYHASEHIWTLAKAFYGDGSPKARRWAHRQCHRLKHQGPRPLLRALRAAHPQEPALAKLLQTERGYFQTNAARMAYPRFREQALPIGSGAVESAASHLVQQRLKRTAGTRWSEAGGVAVLALCAYDASGRALRPLLQPRSLPKAA